MNANVKEEKKTEYQTQKRHTGAAVGRTPHLLRETPVKVRRTNGRKGRKEIKGKKEKKKKKSEKRWRRKKEKKRKKSKKNIKKRSLLT
jgi:hypothetical protein